MFFFYDLLLLVATTATAKSASVGGRSAQFR